MSMLGRLPNMNRGSRPTTGGNWFPRSPSALRSGWDRDVCRLLENDHDEPSAVQPGDAASAMNAANVLNEGAGGEASVDLAP
jgi:hypothetical protein